MLSSFLRFTVSHSSIMWLVRLFCCEVGKSERFLSSYIKSRVNYLHSLLLFLMGHSIEILSPWDKIYSVSKMRKMTVGCTLLWLEHVNELFFIELLLIWIITDFSCSMSVFLTYRTNTSRISMTLCLSTTHKPIPG